MSPWYFRSNSTFFCVAGCLRVPAIDVMCRRRALGGRAHVRKAMPRQHRCQTDGCHANYQAPHDDEPVCALCIFRESSCGRPIARHRSRMISLACCNTLAPPASKLWRRFCEALGSHSSRSSNRATISTSCADSGKIALALAAEPANQKAVRLSTQMARAVFAVLAVCSTTAAFAPPARTAPRVVAPRAQKEPMNADGTKKRSEMTDWEIYTDGEYGRAFKFPWEVEATDLTTIGHVIPVAIVLSFYLVPLAYGVATGRIDLSALS